MNQRIRELAEQADLKEIIDDAYQERDDWQPFVDKFAELIVRECAEIARVWSVEGVEYDGSDAIREHFGVER